MLAPTPVASETENDNDDETRTDSNSTHLMAAIFDLAERKFIS